MFLIDNAMWTNRVKVWIDHFCLRFIQGTEVDTPYVFYHWKYIDIFNYFSHHMVTIPPAMWTNAAHKHGVLSLGQSPL